MSDDPIRLSEPDISERELELVRRSLMALHLSSGPLAEAFERMFAQWLGRRFAVAVSSGTQGTLAVLQSMGFAPGDEIVTTGHSWHQVAHAITLAGLKPVFSDIDYWSGCMCPVKAAARIGPRTRAILAGNVNGHPAPWRQLRALATQRGIRLIEDSTEAVGSRYLGKLAGSFGDAAVFDFSLPSALCCGEGGMVATDDEALAFELRYRRRRRIEDRGSLSVGSRVPLQAALSDIAAAVGIAQLERIDEILARRKQVEAWYHAEMQSFEGIKPPYLGEDVDKVHWLLYVVHLGKRFTASARAQIIDDLQTNDIEAAAYSHLLSREFHYEQFGGRRGLLPDAERIADRALALPLHTHLTQDQIGYIVATLKDAAGNVGAGAAIY